MESAAASPPAPGGRRRRLLLVVLAVAAWALLYLHLAGLAAWLVRAVPGLSAGSHLAAALEFFLYEVPKVLLLLALVVFAVGVVRSFFTPERTRALLAGRREALGNVLAALLGVVTPFCSCSAVPLFIGFVTAGVPLGVTFSFLIAAPLINEVALVLLWDLFGWRVALLYLATGLAIAMVAGWVLGRLRLERWVEPWVYAIKPAAAAAAEHAPGPDRVAAGLEAVRDIVAKVWPWVVLGIAVGAGIHGWVPEGALAVVLGREAWWSVPLAVLLGVPMYANAASIIPVVQALLGKGAALGTALAFMMAVIGLSLPEALILRRVLTLRLILVFFAIVAAGIVAVGYLFNAIGLAVPGGGTTP